MQILMYILLGALAGFEAVASTEASTVRVDLSGNTSTPFPHYWKRSFGSGHATLTLRKDWQSHLAAAVKDLGLTGVRHHGLFDDDMAVVVAPGKFDFTKIDASWDYQLSLDVTPIVELSFMPAHIANCTWTSPDGATVVNPGKAACHTGMQYRYVDDHPAGDDWSLWYDLVKALVQHAVDRYGLSAVQSWHFEVWNEVRPAATSLTPPTV